jgi:hypothetical protein
VSDNFPWRVEAFDPETEEWVCIGKTGSELHAWSMAGAKQPFWPAPIRYFHRDHPDAVPFDYEAMPDEGLELIYRSQAVRA